VRPSVSSKSTGRGPELKESTAKTTPSLCHHCQLEVSSSPPQASLPTPPPSSARKEEPSLPASGSHPPPPDHLQSETSPPAWARWIIWTLSRLQPAVPTVGDNSHTSGLPVHPPFPGFAVPPTSGRVPPPGNSNPFSVPPYETTPPPPMEPWAPFRATPNHFSAPFLPRETPAPYSQPPPPPRAYPPRPRVPPSPVTPLQNFYAPLAEASEATETASPYIWPSGQVKPRRSPKPPTPPPPPEQTSVNLRVAQTATDLCHGYYLPGKLAGQSVNGLVDSGCSVSVVAHRVFQNMRRHIRDKLVANAGTAAVADGSRTRTYGTLAISGKLRHWNFSHTFLIADIAEDALLGLDFLQLFGASIDFRTAELRIGNIRLLCQDEQGYPMRATVQCLRRVKVPPRSELVIKGRLDRPIGKKECAIEAGSGPHTYLVDRGHCSGPGHVRRDTGTNPYLRRHSSP